MAHPTPEQVAAAADAIAAALNAAAELGCAIHCSDRQLVIANGALRSENYAAPVYQSINGEWKVVR